MTTFKVKGGYKLSGDIHPQGAKNEALQVLCAVLLTSEEVIMENIPCFKCKACILTKKEEKSLHYLMLKEEYYLHQLQFLSHH